MRSILKNYKSNVRKIKRGGVERKSYDSSLQEVIKTTQFLNLLVESNNVVLVNEILPVESPYYMHRLYLMICNFNFELNQSQGISDKKSSIGSFIGLLSTYEEPTNAWKLSVLPSLKLIKNTPIEILIKWENHISNRLNKIHSVNQFFSREIVAGIPYSFILTLLLILCEVFVCNKALSLGYINQNYEETFIEICIIIIVITFILMPGVFYRDNFSKLLWGCEYTEANDWLLSVNKEISRTHVESHLKVKKSEEDLKVYFREFKLVAQYSGLEIIRALTRIDSDDENATNFLNYKFNDQSSNVRQKQLSSFEWEKRRIDFINKISGQSDFYMILKASGSIYISKNVQEPFYSKRLIMFKGSVLAEISSIDFESFSEENPKVGSDFFFAYIIFLNGIS